MAATEQLKVLEELSNMPRPKGFKMTEEHKRRIGLANYKGGRHNNNCHDCGAKIKNSSKRCSPCQVAKDFGSGKTHSNYKDGKRLSPYKGFTDRLRRNIRKRDNEECQLCGIKQELLTKKLCVHHIDFDKKNNADTNLISLCPKCHSFSHKKDNNFKELISVRG